jgi:flagellar biosynthesis/type III secretory pathway protein FliH
MSDEAKEIGNKWEDVTDEAYEVTEKLKVSGGYLYRTIIYEKEGGSDRNVVAMSFVPDVDLTRYQSHLRDAYNQGIKDGISQEQENVRKAIRNLDEAYKAGFNDGKEEGIIDGVHRGTGAA